MYLRCDLLSGKFFRNKNLEGSCLILENLSKGIRLKIFRCKSYKIIRDTFFWEFLEILLKIFRNRETSAICFEMNANEITFVQLEN